MPKLGIDIGETSVGKYIARKRKPRSQGRKHSGSFMKWRAPQTLRRQSWKTFLENLVKITVSIDFFPVPTIRFQVLLALAHHRRRSSISM